MKNKPVPVGIIGCGGIMRSVYTPTLRSMPDLIRVAAVCDLNESAASAIAGQFANAAVFTDVGEMFRKAGLEAVLVLTNEEVNARMARVVIEANLPVYLEKPPAASSVELEDLIAADAQSPVKVYTAFNRRHTPLFANLDFPTKKLRRVYGALKRQKRKVSTFHHTSVHLIDSSQHFAGSLFKTWKVDFERKAENSVWIIKGLLENGAECSLELVPDGKEFTEFLVLETDQGVCKLLFPNNQAPIKEGEIDIQPGDGSAPTITRGNPAMPSVEAMGFRACLENFIGQLETGNTSGHRPVSCRSTIAIMEEMESALS